MKIKTKIMKEAKAYHDKNWVIQNIQLDQLNDLIIRKIGAITPITKYAKTNILLLKLFSLIMLAYLSFRLFGAKTCSIVTIIHINDIVMAISLFIMVFITFMSIRIYSLNKDNDLKLQRNEHNPIT